MRHGLCVELNMAQPPKPLAPQNLMFISVRATSCSRPSCQPSRKMLRIPFRTGPPSCPSDWRSEPWKLHTDGYPCEQTPERDRDPPDTCGSTAAQRRPSSPASSQSSGPRTAAALCSVASHSQTTTCPLCPPSYTAACSSKAAAHTCRQRLKTCRSEQRLTSVQ